MSIFMLLFTFLISSFYHVFAVDYYVSSSIGSASNDGMSPERPFLSLNSGRNAAQPGDTVHIMDGTYRNNGYGTGRYASGLGSVLRYLFRMLPIITETQIDKRRI